MKTTTWEQRERRVRIGIIRDLIRLDLLNCKPVSVRRSTRPLASVKTRSLALAQAETQTMATEHAH